MSCFQCVGSAECIGGGFGEQRGTSGGGQQHLGQRERKKATDTRTKEEKREIEKRELCFSLCCSSACKTLTRVCVSLPLLCWGTLPRTAW